jgi:Na+/H+ antiporter NhaC
MDLLATILSAILIWGVIGVGVATAWTLRRVIATRNMRGHKWSAHSAHILTDTMIHYRPNIRTIR